MYKSDSEDRTEGLVGRAEAAAGSLADDVKNQVEGLATRQLRRQNVLTVRLENEVRGAAATVTTSVEQQPLIALLAVGLICGTVGFLLGRR